MRRYDQTQASGKEMGVEKKKAAKSERGRLYVLQAGGRSLALSFVSANTPGCILSDAKRTQPTQIRLGTIKALGRKRKTNLRDPYNDTRVCRYLTGKFRRLGTPSLKRVRSHEKVLRYGTKVARRQLSIRIEFTCARRVTPQSCDLQRCR